MRRITPKLTAFFAGFCLSLSTAQAVEIAQSPLFVTNTADPNILFILDDSGSMRWGFAPDELVDDIGVNLDPIWATDDDDLCPGRLNYAGVQTCVFPVDGKKAAVSSTTNPLYYNPSQTYTPPMKGDGTRYPDAVYSAAWVDGYDSGDSGALVVDLTDNYRAVLDPYYRSIYFCEGSGNLSADGQSYSCSGGGAWYSGFALGSLSNTADGESGDSAFFYNFLGGDGCSSAPYPDSCFSSAKSPSTDAEKQNFANWFSYYRNRQLLSRAGITDAFIDQSENMRVGYGSLDAAGTIVRGVKPFSGTDRTAFFNWLQSADAPGATPLRGALQDAGEYYSRASTEADNPWRTNTESQADPEYVECRQSFTILMTDGYWNDDDVKLESVGNQDGADGETITGPSGRSYKYTAVDPFKDSASDTLADVAMKFWKNDLQSGIANRVPTTEQNPAFWQHMNTYGVGLGVTGTINPQTAFDAISSESAVTWPDPTASGSADSAKIDDLLHASLNSRGGFFSVSDPTTFGEELGKTIGQITEAVGSASGITFDTATLEEDSLMFSARFDSSFWQGDLDARPLIYNPGDDEPTIGPRVWSAADKLDARDPSSRVILTHNGSSGVPFTWSSLTQAQRNDLSFGAATGDEATEGQARLDYVRGDRSQEGDGFRVRASRLGDIVHSTPVRVARPASPWPDSAQFGEDTKRYSDFRAAKADRTPVIYVGANDGMLHGFKATEDGGEELIAYVPGSVYSSEPSKGLHHLANTGYSHQYYVDLSPLVSDVYIKSIDPDGTLSAERNWRTVLFGGLRAGGRGIFALDVTDPTNFSETAAGQLALWEFGYDADDDRVNLGYSIQPPQVAMANWGVNQADYRWTAFVSNGYNAETDSTGFYMIDIEGGIGSNWSEGNNFQYIEFSSTGGGLSPLTLYDFNGDKIVDRVYAGDTQGRMWVAENDKGWVPSYVSNPDKVPVPLFTAPAVGDPAERQAITSAPMVIPNAGQKPEGEKAPDSYVIFGTGKYLGFDDITDSRQQALYAVRDIDVGDRDISDLAKRTLVEKKNFEGNGLDLLFSEADSSSTSDDLGWYVNLLEPGERIYLTPQVRGRYIFATSILPSTNPCIAGGESRPMAFGLDGLTPDKAVFRSIPYPATSFKKIDGIANSAAFLGNFMFTPTSGGGEPDIEGIDVGNVSDNLGRQGWQELIAD